MAILTSLVRLHVSILHQNPDWQPLAQLSGLQDLALQCQEDMSSCAQVLISNRANLQRVVIASRSWDHNTYAALPHLQSLHTISIKVDSLTTPEATVVGNLLAPRDIRMLIRRCDLVTPRVFWALSSGTAAVTQLVVWESSKVHCHELQQMQHLTLLAVVRPRHDVNVTDFKPQQALKVLSMVSCFGIDDSGVQYITAAFPSLRVVSVLREVEYRAYVDLPIISVQAVVSLAQGRLLDHMCIGGLTGLTRQGIKALRHAIKAQQSAGLSPETVLIVLPSLSEFDGGKLMTYDNLAFPSFTFFTHELGLVLSSLLVVGRLQNDFDSSFHYQSLNRYFTARMWPAQFLLQ